MEPNTTAAMRDSRRIYRLQLCLAAFSIVAVLAGWSRLRPPQFLLIGCGDVLRLREALSMFVYAPLLVLLLWGMFRAAGDRAMDVLTVVFLLGLYFIGVGMGMHDTCDLLGRIYPGVSRELRKSLDFFDNRLGHWVFFAGFILTSLAAGAAQLRHPLSTPLSRRRTAGFLLFSLPLAAVMVTNLMFERTSVDLCVVFSALVAILVLHAIYRPGMRRLPLLLVLYPAYGAALIGPLLYWAVRAK
ncbi:MAG: hypothetical protein GXP31_09935 [Kiritimatiellaeota bacterium]|nr:hypothetical protein [Kiritimatiellota bacterium]